MYPRTGEPPLEVRDQETVIEFLEDLTLTGAVLMIGVEARIKVFLTEKAPFPLFEVVLTLYWTSSVPDIPVCWKYKVLISVVPT